MTQEEIINLVCSDKHNIKAMKLGNGNTQIIISKKLINCAMCNTSVRNEEAKIKQDRRIVGLIVAKKYCKKCAKRIDSVLQDLKTSYKEPIGKSF